MYCNAGGHLIKKLVTGANAHAHSRTVPFRRTSALAGERAQENVCRCGLEVEICNASYIGDGHSILKCFR